MILHDLNPAILELLHSGDPRCKIKLGQRVKKVVREDKDVHFEQDQGVVTGSVSMNGVDAYLVRFDNDTAETFIVGAKIAQV
jgi:hypothetical protein